MFITAIIQRNKLTYNNYDDDDHYKCAYKHSYAYGESLFSYFYSKFFFIILCVRIKQVYRLLK